MTITEKTAYLKGLLEGMEIDQSTKEGKLLMTLHSPNTHLEERPYFFEVVEEDGLLHRK